jgi:2-C-methyl-D-erythritol 4-phosphate cytidylyltransferase
VLPVADTVKEVDSAGWVRRTLDRAVLRAVQTPQGFRRLVLERAHQAATGADSLDDASLVEALGLTVRTVPGDPTALKITTPVDLLTVTALVGQHVG